MNINITGRKTTVREQFKERAEKKLSKLDRFFHNDVKVNVVVTNEGEREKVEISVFDKGMVYRGERTTSDRLESLDLVVDMLFKQIVKHKEKLTKRVRENAFDNLEVTEPAAADEDYAVIKKKSFAVRPMDIQEAILRMNLVGHEFFMFSNSETGEMNVVYKRKDGGYGVIEAQSE